MSVFTVLNPATEEPVTTVDQVSLEQTDEAIARAAAAWPAWREVAPGDRESATIRRLLFEGKVAFTLPQ